MAEVKPFAAVSEHREPIRRIEDYLSDAPPAIAAMVAAVLPQFTPEQRAFVESRLESAVAQLTAGNGDAVLDIVREVSPKDVGKVAFMLTLGGVPHSHTGGDAVEESDSDAQGEPLDVFALLGQFGSAQLY